MDYKTKKDGVTLKRTGCLNAFSLKLVMAALMLLDHLHYFLPSMPDWFHWLGRIVAPTFCYLMTVSLRHTRDRGAFLGRMLSAGLVMLAGSAALQMALGGPAIGNTIFLSLAVSGYIIDLTEKLREKFHPGRAAALILLLAAATFFLEGSAYLPLIAAIFYFLHDRRLLMCLCYILAGGLLMYALVGFTVQQLQAFAVVPILLYNGRRGPGGAFSKWFFYLFYPLHVWALYAIGYWISL